MKKYFLLTLTFVAAINYHLLAGTVGVQSAQTIALSFFKLNNPNIHSALSANLKYTKTETDGTVDFYVFDILPQKSFVIVAADDNIIPILGHSEEGYFNPNFSHFGLNRWVYKTSKNIYKAIQLHVQADSRIKSLWTAYQQGQKPANEKSATVPPLCTTTWDQENDVTAPPPFLYNLFLPWNSTDQQRCLTGCVATAQAQIMKYWNYPAVGKGSFSYTDTYANGYSNNYGTLSSNFATHTYQWPLMPSVLTGDESVAQDSAVDLLMYDCAVSVGMDLGDDNQDGSGANALLAEELQYGDSNCSQQALVEYFSYNADSINGVFEDSFTASAWTALIEHELNVGRPVLYEGNDDAQDTSGHAWVCDGYDVDDNLHMNWGWSGFDNGYFAINNLTTTGDFNPVDQDDALIGILPKYAIAPVTKFAASNTNSCNGNVQFMDLSEDLPISWLWNFGDGNTSTLQNPSHIYAASGTYTITLTATNPAGSTPLTFSNYVTVNLLSAPGVSNVSSATPTSFNLSANTSDDVNWYDAQGNYLSSNNPYVTPVLNSSTTYYVEDSVVNPSYNVGLAPDAPFHGGYLTDPYALKFNVFKPCVIVSVDLIAENPGYRTVQVSDSMGKTIGIQTVYCGHGPNQVALNMAVDAGGPYFMSVADTLGLYSDTTGATYPYSDSAGILSITGIDSAIEDYYPTAYFYFYNWVVKEPDCTSARVPVTASITTGINDVNDAISFTIYPNPAANDVVMQTTETGNGMILNVKNILGQTLLSKSVEEIQTHIDLSTFANGIYLVELNQGEKIGVKKLVINK